MHVTVLGTGAARPDPGGACAGYLVEAGPVRLLVDCGPGTVSRLTKHVALADLDGIIISHEHPDHVLELVIVRQALVHGPERQPDRQMEVHVGAGTAEAIAGLGAVFGDGREFWSPTLNIRPFDPAEVLTIGDVRVAFAPAQHYVPSWAMRFESGGRVLVYTGDTGPSDAVTDLARNADLLVAESTLPKRAGSEDVWGHLAPEDAGVMGLRAGATRLVLTHFFGSAGEDALRRRAADAFGGPVEMAKEGERYEV